MPLLVSRFWLPFPSLLLLLSFALLRLYVVTGTRVVRRLGGWFLIIPVCHAQGIGDVHCACGLIQRQVHISPRRSLRRGSCCPGSPGHPAHWSPARRRSPAACRLCRPAALPPSQKHYCSVSRCLPESHPHFPAHPPGRYLHRRRRPKRPSARRSSRSW